MLEAFTFKSLLRLFIKKFIMQVEIKDNILYGGDPNVFGPLDGNCASIGEFIIKELRKGEFHKTFVSGSFTF